MVPHMTGEPKNARHENAGNAKHRKLRLYKHVKMYIICSSALIYNRLTQPDA